MTVMSVSEVYSQSHTETMEKKEPGVMGKEDFLTLLVAQMQHQDPMNPADGTEFTAQLAQFSSLEELQNIDNTLKGFEVYQSTLNNIQSSGFIGKTVTAAGNTFGVNDHQPAPIQFDLEADADSVYVQVYDQHGGFMTDIQAGRRPAGENQVDWDGSDADGTAVADGAYNFTIMAMNADGEKINATSYTTGVVSGIDYEAGATHLLINNQKIPIASLIRIAKTETDKSI